MLHEYFEQAKDYKKQKGRNPRLLTQRDRKLALRFYYYAKIRKLSYRDTVESLVREFDICDRVVLDRLRANQEYLDWLFSTSPGTKWLQHEMPYFKW